MRPGPMARMRPSLGFSFAGAGRTMPLLVISSRAVGLTTTRSPSGLSLVEAVALANVLPSCGGDAAAEPGLLQAGAWRVARSRPADADLLVLLDGLVSRRVSRSSGRPREPVCSSISTLGV